MCLTLSLHPTAIRRRFSAGIACWSVALGATLNLAWTAQARFDVYVWETHRPRDLSAEAAPLVAHLRRQIDAVLDAGRLAPLRFSGADQINEGFYLYFEPGRHPPNLFRNRPLPTQHPRRERLRRHAQRFAERSDGVSCLRASYPRRRQRAFRRRRPVAVTCCGMLL